MAAAAAAGAAGNGGNGRQAPQGSFLTGLVRMAIMYYVFSSFFGQKAPVDPNTGAKLPPHQPYWPAGEPFEMHLYAAEAPSTRRPSLESMKLLWHETDLYLDHRGSNQRKLSLSIDASPGLLSNGSYALHAFLSKAGSPLDDQDPAYSRTAVTHVAYDLIQYRPRPKVKVAANLLSGESELDRVREANAGNEGALSALRDDAQVDESWISYWTPNVSLTFVPDQQNFPRGGIPPQLADHFRIDRTNGKYFPIVWFNDFWTLASDRFPVNETTPTLPLHLELYPLSMWKWTMYVQMDQSFSMQESWGSANEGDSDDVKEMLRDTNPYLMGLTFAVTLLHSVFDFLAFKNDIQFWKNKKNMEGMSVRSLFVSISMQFIILLYLIDNDTTWFIVVSSSIGLVIECWKVKKAVKITVDRSGSIPRIRWEDRESYKKSGTRQFDETAMRYLSYVMFPLVVGYAIYSLMYETHTGWYSFILQTLVNCVYMFGFILMTPQLWINYKLKSVAHLPWRTFIYKALNTFIDDLFAFIIKMPTAHRLSCFRDDVIFLIYLYQRWIYRVDYKRVNEFGQGGEDEQPDAVGAAVTDSDPAADAGDAAADSGDAAADADAGDATAGAGDADTVLVDGKEKTE